MSILDVHPRSLATSTALSVYYMPNAITPLQVIRLLNAAGIRFVLMGAHGIGGWMRHRATQDVDILVAARGFRKAVRKLLSAFPYLEADDHEVVTRLRDPRTQEVAIDVMKPNQNLMQAALKNTCDVELEGEKYHIPSLEMALALKFAPYDQPEPGARKEAPRCARFHDNDQGQPRNRSCEAGCAWRTCLFRRRGGTSPDGRSSPARRAVDPVSERRTLRFHRPGFTFSPPRWPVPLLPV